MTSLNVTDHAEHLGHQSNMADIIVNIFIAVDVLFILATLTGNLVIIIAVFKNKLLRTPSVLFIVSVASSHIIVGVVVLPMFIVEHFPEEFLDNTICKTLTYVTKLASSGALLAIIPMTIDAFLRHIGFYSDQRPLTWRCSVLQVLGTWTFSALYSVIHCILVEFEMMFGEDEHGRWHTKICHVPHDRQHYHKIIILVDFVIFFLLPVVILTVLLSIILLRHRADRLPPAKNDFEKRQRRQGRISSCIFLIVFTVFNLGNYCIDMYTFWGPGSFRHIHLLMSVFTLIGFTMCWVNVVLLLSFNPTFRRTVLCRPHKHADVEMTSVNTISKNDNNQNQATRPDGNDYIQVPVQIESRL